MASFKESTTIQGKFKALVCTEDGFADVETGEAIDLHTILLKQYGTEKEFSLTAAYKSDIELD